MITAASLRSHTSKALAQMAKKEGIRGWHSMRKEQLVRALLRQARKKSQRNPRSNGSSGNDRATSSKQKSDGTRQATDPSKASSGQSYSSAAKKIQRQRAQRRQLRDLAAGHGTSGSGPSARVRKDRCVLMVRDPYWLHVYWEIDRRSIERARAALGQRWHTAQPTLRLFQLPSNGTTDTSERVLQDVAIHGGVNNWYLAVSNPPQKYRVAIGYLSQDGRFRSLVRSNIVTTPSPGNREMVDRNWSDVAENCERIYAMSGGYAAEGASGELQELLEERLHRPVGSPVAGRFGAGAEGLDHRKHDFRLQVEAELIIHGVTKPGAYVTLSGEPVRVREDGSFAVRMTMPDRRQVLPVVANSADGVEQHTVVLAIERNTKVMEPRILDPNDQTTH